jgi:hypothetical protein
MSSLLFYTAPVTPFFRENLMRSIHALIAAACLTAGALFAQTTAPAAPATAPASAPAAAAPLVITGQMPDELKKKFTDVIALIDNKKYIELLETLAPAEAAKKIKEGPELPKFMERMAEMGPKLRAALVTAAGQNAEMGTDPEGRATATFPKMEGGDIPQLKFTQIEGNWTLK